MAEFDPANLNCDDSTLTPLLQIFSFPGAGAGSAIGAVLERTIFKQHATKIIINALRLLGRNVEVYCPGLEQILGDWLKQSSSHWFRPVGLTWRATIRREWDDIPHRLVEAGLIASKCGIEGNWSFKLNKTFSMWIDDVLMLGVSAGKFHSTKDGLHATLETSSGKKAVHINTANGAGFEVRQGDLRSTGVSLVPHEIVSKEFLPTSAKATFVDSSESQACGIALAAALDDLSRFSPALFTWVTSVIREIVPLRSIVGELASSSSPWDCGTVGITVDSRSVIVSEMLVHEASHQHFFIAKHLGKFDNGTDLKEYFSPMAKQNRTIEKILLAFHAIGNMLIMHSLFIEGSHSDVSLSVERISILSRKLRCIEGILVNSKALTPLGRAIYDPLSVRIDELRKSGVFV